MKWATTTLIACVAALVGLGLVMLYSSSMNMVLNKSAVGADYLISQLVWLGLGLVACVTVARMDYRSWKKISPYLLLGSALLLMLVFAPIIGHGIKGAHRWIGLPHTPRFQPSELAKLSLILFLAAYGDRFQRQMTKFVEGLLIPMAVCGLILGLIFIEPDRGCTILLASVSGAMLVVAGVRLWVLVLPLIGGGAFLIHSLMHDSMRMGRIHAWLHPELAREGAGYQAYQAMVALGSGGWTGLGLGNGRQKLGFVPEHHTDFIFSIIGEELGLIATLAVVVAFILLICCGIYISKRSCDMFGFLLGSGITFMIGLQAIINLGVVTSLLPNKGMPLPFISYGGSNLLLLLVAVGFLVSIARHANDTVKTTFKVKRSNPFDASQDLHDAYA